MIEIRWVADAFPSLRDIEAIQGGGQKFIYRAAHPIDGDVVLKFFKPGTDTDTVQREIMAVQRVSSPRVPKIFETGSLSTPVGECAWLREQRIAGESLRSRLQRGPLNTQELLRLAHQMATTLRDAEQASIVHRDVKPDNIMLDHAGNFWLLDFGIARHLTMTSLTADTLIFGKFTPGYAPPEQTRNQKPLIDSRADMFALGVTLVEAATGVHPFWNGASDALVALTRAEKDPIPRQMWPVQKADLLADLLDAMTKKRRDQRCKDMQEVLNWLEDVISLETP